MGRWHWFWVRDGQRWEFYAPGRSRMPYWRNALYLGSPRLIGRHEPRPWSQAERIAGMMGGIG